MSSKTQDPKNFHADVAELVDALVLGTSDFGRGGSSPFIRTRIIRYSRTYRRDLCQINRRGTLANIGFLTAMINGVNR